MDVRKNITVPGIPFKWTTNLTDDEILDFCAKYSDQIEEPIENPNPQKGKIVIPFRMGFLPFREGFCFWSATGENQTVLYRSNQDWEIWDARQKEIEELRQEQAAELAAEKLLVMTEDGHLKEKTENAIAAGDYEGAASYVFARAELREKFKQFRSMPIEWGYWYPDSILARFPSSQYGIDFFQRFRPLPQSFTNFARWYFGGSGLKGEKLVEQTWAIYKHGMEMYPNHGRIAQDACLFFRRVKKYDLAIAICVEAIKQGLKDGTKSGFEGRLRRLEEESRKHQ